MAETIEEVECISTWRAFIRLNQWGTGQDKDAFMKTTMMKRKLLISCPEKRFRGRKVLIWLDAKGAF